MKVVKVYGALRELLGKNRFEFVAETPAQAMRALLVNFPELHQWLLDSEKNGIAYRVTVGKQKIHNDDVSGLFSPWSEREVFSIAPVVVGAGGAGRIIAGVALVALAVVTYGGSLAVSAAGLGVKAGLTGFAATGAALAVGAVYAGGYLILSGVAQMISPAPKPPGPAEAPTQLESNSFSGIVNTNRQGIPVPIAYGRVFVGSAVISSGLDVDRIK